MSGHNPNAKHSDRDKDRHHRSTRSQHSRSHSDRNSDRYITERDKPRHCHEEERHTYKRRHQDSQRRYVKPYTSRSRHVEPVETDLVSDDPVSRRPFFCGLIPREDVEMILLLNGEFTVRKIGKSGQSNHYSNLCVSVKWKNKVHHVLIRLSKRGMFTLEDREFNTVDQLIYYYYVSQKVLTQSSGAKLLVPLRNTSWLLHDDQLQPIRVLGKGNFGEVWKASMVTSSNETTQVAVKLLKDDGVPEEERQLFFAECRKLRQLNHRHLVGFVGIIVDTEPVKLVMELCNDTLLSLLKRENLSWKRKSRICLHVARGMEYLARCSVIHRDLAARNCLIKDDVVKISDLGMARTGKVYELKDRKKPIPVKWTSPETLKTRIYSESSDVWAYGILLWEIYADGKPPYEEMQTQYGPAFTEHLIKFLASGKRLEAPVDTPRKLNELMLKCLREVSAQRPSFKAIRLELETLYGEQGGELSFEQPPTDEMNTCNEPPEEGGAGGMRTTKA
uniref:Tyrosine-protein kinase n=1 Tax=Trichuris muris TaxID=70415 RepID=A0A5S6QHZ0_TRIMR